MVSTDLAREIEPAEPVETTGLVRLTSLWLGHRPALSRIALLYRDPARFREQLAALSPRARLCVAFGMWLHALPYASLLLFLCSTLLGLPPAGAAGDVLTGVLGSVVIGLAGGATIAMAAGSPAGIAAGLAFTLLGQIGFGIAAALARGPGFGIAFGVETGFVGGLIFGTTVAVVRGVVGGVAASVAVGVAFSAGYGVAFWIVDGLWAGVVSTVVVGTILGLGIGNPEEAGGQRLPAAAGGAALGLAVTLAGSPLGGLLGGTLFAVAQLRLYYHLVHPFFFWPRLRGDRYPSHPVAWDSACAVPFPQLDQLLAAFHAHDPERGEAEIERLITRYPSQRQAALRARVVLVARDAAAAPRLSLLDKIVARLPEGERGFLAETRRVREMVHEVAVLQARLDAIDRPFLREPLTHLLRSQIELLRDRVSGFHEPLATEMRAAAGRWLETVTVESDRCLFAAATPQVFRAGDPVDRGGEAFIPRYSLLGELERQIALATGCPGLVLYGRRRMGKSTLLRNLPGLLPPGVRPVILSMQEPQAFSSTEGLCRLLGRYIRKALPEFSGADEPVDLPGLFRFLAAANEVLDQCGQRLLLALDEYEGLDLGLGRGVFSEDLLATLRESIQSHRRLIWTFAGSHEITELRHAPWTSYLVSLRTIEIRPFSAAETRLLLTEPLKHSPLWKAGDPACPRFVPEFWGDETKEAGIQRIHTEAGGWPHLVQLIAEAVVDLVNDHQEKEADRVLLDKALDLAVVRGHNVLYELMDRECTLPGEWEYLAGFRGRDLQPPPSDEGVHRSLRRRLLVEPAGGEWRLRVPLMERWLRQRG